MRGPRCRSAVVSGEWAVRAPTARFVKGAICCYSEIGRYAVTRSRNISANSLKTGGLHLCNFLRLFRSLEQGNTLISAWPDDRPRIPGRTCGLTEAGAQLLAGWTNAHGKNLEVISAFPHRAMTLLSKTTFTWDESVAGVGCGELTWRTVNFAPSVVASDSRHFMELPMEVR